MQQQQQIYQAHQQQQYQTLRRKSQPVNPQQLAAMQQQQQQLPPPHPQLLSQQPLQNNTQMLQMQAQIQMQQQIYQQQQNLPPPPQIAHVSPQQQQSQVAHIPPQQQHPPQNIQQQQSQYIMTTISTPAPPSATMANAQPNNSIYVQSKTFVETTIPNSIAIDSAMYERDKQIYKCSTLRHGGKYGGSEHHHKQTPAVIPTVPQIPKYNNGPVPTTAVGPVTAQSAQLGNNIANIRPSIQNCPLPEIPKHSELGQFKDLPQNR